MGVMAACRPAAAYQAGFDLAFVTDGYAKTASAMMAAAVAAAMHAQPTIDGVIDDAVEAHLDFARQREGPHWYGGLSSIFKTGAVASSWRYDPNLQFLTTALEIARREHDVFAIRDPLYANLDWGTCSPRRPTPWWCRWPCSWLRAATSARRSSAASCTAVTTRATPASPVL